MASIFTYQDEPPRIHSPWSTPGNATPQAHVSDGLRNGAESATNAITKLEPEKQDGPCEYKLHLLLRARRKFLSMTTTDPSLSSTQMAQAHGRLGTRSMSELLLHRPSYQPSPQTRQARLQQLTTQLLWRLQQSSPFHSSSNAELVLPILPEATPRLGVPERPAKLLPGLEESQGALYEIGVADDGALVGLANDELEESLNNLRAMAASLGCVVDILRRVKVGSCTWTELVEGESEFRNHLDELFVAEVLVRPDSRAVPDILVGNSMRGDSTDVPPPEGSVLVNEVRAGDTKQMRVALVGASTCGKSSLVGTLTTSMLDNGRGKSRLSLLKHRHEIASGVTSSVAQELIGYRSKPGVDDFVVNYASGDVSSWTDIHNLANRLCFLTDSPGLPRYAKSTFRALVSWKPRWTIACVSADDGDEVSVAATAVAAGSTEAVSPDLSMEYLDLCLRLDLPLVVAITKMDIATKTGLRSVLAKVLSALKAAGRRPLLLSTPSMPVPAFALDSKEALPDLQKITDAEQEEVDRIAGCMAEDNSVVPVLMTSAVSGSGIGKLHALLHGLPLAPSVLQREENTSSMFRIDEVFSIPPSRVYSADVQLHEASSGVVLCGHLERGRISIGDTMLIGPFSAQESRKTATITRSKSCTSQDFQKAFQSVSMITQSYQSSPQLESNGEATLADQFASVTVVSIRNLRLPVMSMRQGETGTIGIELSGSASGFSLDKARKGMVLQAGSFEPGASHSFVACFPSTDFDGAASPALILGGHAIAYINNIRAAVKVTAVALAEDGPTEPGSPVDMFAFDTDEEAGEIGGHQEKEIKITFRFVSTIEWVQEEDQVLVVPTVSAAGPVAGPSVVTTGLAGFVGRITDLGL